MTRFQFKNGDRPLDGYTIEYALGRGGFGEVYYAVSDAGRQVALKAVQNYEEIELRGIGHCMNLKSQHLVSIFDVKHGSDGTPWVIMEFIAGPSLRDLLDESPTGLGPEKSSFFIRELAKGLGYLHGAGVVHRDLKPHNVFFEEGVVKIGDYSLSKAITTSHRSGHTMTVGTVHYMAPEIGMGRYDKTVDIYALGVMLFEMLTGTPPYTGDSMGEVLMKHLSAEPDVSGLDEPFASVIRKAMQRDPVHRYQSAEEMATALQGVDGIADSITGFGPASLSIVADRAAKKMRPASEESTGRINAALATTQPEHRALHEVDPMRQLGRDLGRVAYHAAIIGDSKSIPEVASGSDPVAAPWRYTLAVATLPIMAAVGVAMSDSFGAPPGSYIIDGTPSRDSAPSFSWSMSNRFVVDAFGVFYPSAAILIAALGVRGLVERGILPERAKRCRIAHLAMAILVITVLVVVEMRPAGAFVIVNLVAAAMPIVIQNWCLLTAPSRAKRIRLWPVLFAAVIAFVAAEVLGANSMFTVAIAVGSALSVQVWTKRVSQVSDRSDQTGQPVTTGRPVDAAQAETQQLPQAPIQSLVAAE